ncbi:hypothetical protein [Nannocystis pusilla]|uniref:hypothetical protein n=1 Tax=Nannocystis pusilla TaxID=889268 RepID=UPI003B8272B3
MAIFRRHDGYVVFDPNFGAYRFDDREQATRFFVRLWDEIYRARSGMGWIQGIGSTCASRTDGSTSAAPVDDRGRDAFAAGSAAPAAAVRLARARR